MEEWSETAVSVIMPVYNQGAFVRRAIESLMAQTHERWELIIINDGCTDRTDDFLSSYLSDSRVKYVKNEKNRGLGCALNQGIEQAVYDIIAYLPADDFFDARHLEVMVRTFCSNDDAVLVFNGIRFDESLESGVMSWRACKGVIPGYSLQLVQTAHRRTADRWVERNELVTENLFIMFWYKLSRRGVFVPTGEVTCEWTNHPHQRHKICGEIYGGGLNKYRSFYHVTSPLRFRAYAGKVIDEKIAYAEYRKPLQMRDGGLKILLVGELAYNPERIMALEEAGHKLYGLWALPRFCYSTVGPLPFGHVEDVPYKGWRERVAEIKPDVIYALLSTSSIELAHEVLMSGTGIPLVWHFKEGPHEAMKAGLWDKLVDLYTFADGCIYLNDDVRKWFGLFVPERVERPEMMLDGDMPKAECLNGQFSAKLSETDGDVHTVVTGRMIGLTPEGMKSLAANGIHVHLYSENNISEKQMVEPFRKAAPKHFHTHRHCQQSEWVREFSKYDAGWLHCVESNNGGSLVRATWADLNIPARINTLAAAGLPMILNNNEGNICAQQSYVCGRGMGLVYNRIDDLIELLKDKKQLSFIAGNVMSERVKLTFDSHVSVLTDFFRKTIGYAHSAR